MSSHDPITVPGQLGPYRLLRRIGHGGSSQVFLAEVYGASGFAKRVAVKTLLPQYLGDPAYERLFIREARLGARLFHQNLVQIHDFGVADGIQYMCLDYVDGVDLAEFRGDDPIPKEDALFIALELGRALEYLHGATDTEGRPLGLIHRDLTPGNVLISKTGEVRLSDFGILKATKMAGVTRGRVRRGTFCYMSPEQVRGEELTAASDQFALGCILAEMLLGVRPFEAGSLPDIKARIEAGDARGLDELDGELSDVVRTLLALDPADRFPTTGAAREALAFGRKTSLRSGAGM